MWRYKLTLFFPLVLHLCIIEMSKIYLPFLSTMNPFVGNESCVSLHCMLQPTGKSIPLKCLPAISINSNYWKKLSWIVQCSKCLWLGKHFKVNLQLLLDFFTKTVTFGNLSNLACPGATTQHHSPAFSSHSELVEVDAAARCFPCCGVNGIISPGCPNCLVLVWQDRHMLFKKSSGVVFAACDISADSWTVVTRKPSVNQLDLLPCI